MWAGAGKCLGSGAFGVVYAAEWDGIPVVIKFPGETCDNSFEYTHDLLQHEEEIYRYVDRHLEECTGAAYLPWPTAVTELGQRTEETSASGGLSPLLVLLCDHVRSDGDTSNSDLHWDLGSVETALPSACTTKRQCLLELLLPVEVSKCPERMVPGIVQIGEALLG